MTEENYPIANPTLEVSEFDSDARKPMSLCVLPTDNEPVRFALPSLYLDLVHLFDGKTSVEEAIGKFRQQHGEQYSHDWVERLIRQSLLPKGILVYKHQDPARVARSQQPRLAFLYIKLPILKPAVVEPIAHSLAFLFKRSVAVILIACALIAHFYVYGVLVDENSVDFNALSAGSILLLMLLSTLGTMFHEFGHASAAAHYNCRRMTIGWGLYLIYTVLWTNVSEAWKLPRGQRAVIDIAGIYFEALFLCLMLLLFLYTGQSIFLFAFIFIDLSIAVNFNPFLRMDGYWLMSDLFGIVNLRKQQALLADRTIQRIFGRKHAVAPEIEVNLSRKAQRALMVYSVLGLVFIGYMLTIIFKHVIMKVAVGFPGLVAEFWGQHLDGMNLVGYAAAFVELGWRALVMLGAGILIYRVIGRIWRFFRRVRLVRQRSSNLEAEAG